MSRAGHCFDRAEIAMLASLDPDDATGELHLAACAACRAAVAEQRAIRQLIRRAPAPPLPRGRREAIAAEVMARADAMAMPPAPPAAREAQREAQHEAQIDGAPGAAGDADATALVEIRRDPWRRVVGIAVAAAAAVVVVARWPRPAAPVVPALDLTSLSAVPGHGEAPSLAVRGTASLEALAPAPPAIVRADGPADFTRAAGADHDVIALRGGSVMLDALETREVAVTLNNTTVLVDRARVRVIAEGGAIASVTVFAGSAEITADGKRTVLEAGMVWVPEIGPVAALDEFRAGWTALRDGDYLAAIAAFGRASDPVVAEDAAYWSAVASERAGDRADAARRFAAFVAKFPASPHVEAARRAIARLR